MRIKPAPGPYHLDPPGVTIQITEEGAEMDYNLVKLKWEWVDDALGPILRGLGFIAFEEGGTFALIVKFEGKEICVGGGHYAPA